MTTGAEHRNEAQRRPAESGGGHPALGAVMEVVTQAGEDGLPILMETALDALFSDAVRAHVMEEAGKGLQELTNSTLDAIPDSTSGQQLQRELAKAERRLRMMLQDSIDSMFTQSARAEFQRHLEAAARDLVHGDGSAASDQAEQALQALLSEIIRVLQRHWAEALRLLLGVLAKALQETLASHVKDAFASITEQPAEAVDEKAEPLKEKFAEKAEELRTRLVETRNAMQQRLAEASEQTQARLGGGVSGTMTYNAQRQRQVGCPPSLRPPSGPSRSPGPGKAPRGLPPSVAR